ncbi:MAG: hypothetical protein ACYDAQ_13910, partial [Mycobacteriales bacterium]
VPLALAIAVSAAVGGGFQVRYTAIVYPFWILAVAVGVVRLPGPRIRAGVLTGVVVGGLIAGLVWGLAPRTQAGEIAAALRAKARPGDVVGYCPDQLGPDVARLVPASEGLVQVAYADPAGPALVDWVDYPARMAAADPAAFAARLLALAGPGGRVWLVTHAGYRGLGLTCVDVAAALGEARGGSRLAVAASGRFYESASLLEFPPSALR